MINSFNKANLAPLDMKKRSIIKKECREEFVITIFGQCWWAIVYHGVGVEYSLKWRIISTFLAQTAVLRSLTFRYFINNNMFALISVSYRA